MNINELKEKNLRELVEIGGDLDVADARDMRKDDLVERILQRQVERGGQVYATGILDIVDEGFGFMRRHGLMPSQDDVYVSSSQVRRFGLRPGDVSAASSGRPRTARSTGACCASSRSTASIRRPPSVARTSTS